MKAYQNYTIFTFILGISALFASYLTTVFAILPIIGIIYIISIAYYLGKLIFNCQELIEKTILGLLFEIFVIAIVGSAFFYCYKLNNIFFIFITLNLPILIFFLGKYFDLKHLTSYKSNFQAGNRTYTQALTQKCVKKSNLAFLILVIIYLTLTASLFCILTSHSTSLPMRTPWEALPKYFFVIFFIDTVALITILLKRSRIKKINYKLILISTYLFLFFTVVYFVYKLGYGFDPFIHRATMDIIVKTGIITPKPFYYIGEYSLIFYLSKLLGANVSVLEKILVPLFAAIFLPAILYHYLTKKFQYCEMGQDNAIDGYGDLDKTASFNWMIILSIFLIPFNFLIVTTPQNLANLFLIILIIFTLNSLREEKNSISNIILILNALAIFCVHPISGIPAFFFLALFFLWQNYQNKGKKKYFKSFFILTCLGLVSFPALWLANSIISPQTAITINSKILNELALYLQNLKLLTFGNIGQFKIILNIIYFFYFNLPTILTLVFIFSLKNIYQEKKIKKYIPYLASFLIFFLNYLALKIFINFGFLINYERDDYADRVAQIAYLFLLPFFLIFINDFWQKIKLKNFKTQYFLTVVLSICLCASLYITYPRHDNFTASHGYNTSKYDIMAVDYIDKNSKENFIVLANQQVSAAALQQFGFKKYYDTSNGKLFYYSIPTGSAFYQYYLEMVDKKPTKEIMESAMKLADVKEGYFVVNKYWWGSGRIVDLAKFVADEYVVIGDGDVYVFKFTTANTPKD